MARLYQNNFHTSVPKQFDCSWVSAPIGDQRVEFVDGAHVVQMVFSDFCRITNTDNPSRRSDNLPLHGDFKKRHVGDAKIRGNSVDSQNCDVCAELSKQFDSKSITEGEEPGAHFPTNHEGAYVLETPQGFSSFYIHCDDLNTTETGNLRRGKETGRTTVNNHRVGVRHHVRNSMSDGDFQLNIAVQLQVKHVFKIRADIFEFNPTMNPAKIAVSRYQHLNVPPDRGLGDVKTLGEIRCRRCSLPQQDLANSIMPLSLFHVAESTPLSVRKQEYQRAP